MRPVKKLLLTFDYEPFLGIHSGTALKCMLEPTQALAGVLSTFKAKAVFFVDVLYLMNLKEHQELKKDVEAIHEQLRALYAQGHYIFPHLHTHWLDAKFDKETKQFVLTNASRYSLARIHANEAAQLFHEAIHILKEIGINYNEWGYRAGGWCIQPFSRYRQSFETEHISYDFSVFPGFKNDHPDQLFDYSMVSKTGPYRFSEAVEQFDDNGSFVEFPISVIEIGKFVKAKDRIVRKFLWNKGDRGWGDGIGIKTASLKVHKDNFEMISIELLTRAKLGSYKRHLDKSDYMHWISHPKMLTRHGLKMFEQFMRYADSHYELVFDLQKMLP